MHRPTAAQRRPFWNALVALGLASALLGCDGSSGSSSADTAATVRSTARYKAVGDEGLGVSVVILLDNSGSMKNKAPGDSRPKAALAKEAIQRTLDATDAAIARRPDYPVKVSLILFSEEPRTVLAMQPYNRDSIRAAIARVPAPRGGTGIGDAMQHAREILYRSGTFRKIILVLTDGENTSGADPADVAHEIFARSEGSVGMYFVAFDTDPDKFGFLADVKGEVVAAQNGEALKTSLSSLYESKVLAESATEPSAAHVVMPTTPSKSHSASKPH